MSDQNLSRSLLVNTLWSFVGRFGYLTVGLMTNIILVRLLGPKEFGQVGIVMFFIVVASVLAESGLSGALVRKQNATEVDYSTIFIFNLFVSLFLMAILILTSGVIAEFYSDPELKNVLIASSFVLLINALRVTQVVKLLKELKFRRKAIYEFLSVFIASIVAVFLAYKGAGIWSLVVLQILTATILTLLLWGCVGPLKKFEFSKNSFRKFYAFGINTTAASLLNAVFDNIYQLILAKCFSIVQTGYFYQAKKLQEMPVGVIQSATLGVVYSTLVKLQGLPEQFNALYQNVMRFFTVLVGLICLVIFYYAEVIISVLYGEKWISSVFYLQLLITASFFNLQEMFNRVIFKVFDKTEKILQLELFKKTIQSITVGYGIWSESIENLLYGFILISVISFFVNYYYARKVQNYFLWSDFSNVLKVLGAAIASVIFCNFIEKSFNLFGVGVLLLFPLLVIVYLLILHFFRVVDILEDTKSIRSLVIGDVKNI